MIKCRSGFALTHEWHPHGWAMGCLLRVLQRKWPRYIEGTLCWSYIILQNGLGLLHTRQPLWYLLHVYSMISYSQAWDQRISIIGCYYCCFIYNLKVWPLPHRACISAIYENRSMPYSPIINTHLLSHCMHNFSNLKHKNRLSLQNACFRNPTMHLPHIPQYTIQNRNVHISVMNRVLWDMRLMHCGICKTGVCHTFGCIVGFVRLVYLTLFMHCGICETGVFHTFQVSCNWTSPLIHMFQ